MHCLGGPQDELISVSGSRALAPKPDQNFPFLVFRKQAIRRTAQLRRR
jgi:hypothetical protein